MKYNVTITEELKRTVTVEADSPWAAEAKAECMRNAGDIILVADDFFDYEISGAVPALE